MVLLPFSLFSLEFPILFVKAGAKVILSGIGLDHSFLLKISEKINEKYKPFSL